MPLDLQAGVQRYSENRLFGTVIFSVSVLKLYISTSSRPGSPYVEGLPSAQPAQPKQAVAHSAPGNISEAHRAAHVARQAFRTRLSLLTRTTVPCVTVAIVAPPLGPETGLGRF